MPGPLPNATRRRRNAPTIPTTVLPVGGRKGRAPKLPPFARLGDAGRAWWLWAWHTPQAAAWAPGHEGVVARRASLEDALAESDGAPLALLREVRELDDRLGLTPKAMAQLRWTIGEADEKPEVERDGKVLTPERWRKAVGDG